MILPVQGELAAKQTEGLSPPEVTEPAGEKVNFAKQQTNGIAYSFFSTTVKIRDKNTLTYREKKPDSNIALAIE